MEGMERTVEATIVNYAAGLVVVDVGMAAELGKGELVDVELLRHSRGGYGEEGFRIGGETLYLVELGKTDIATKALTVLDNKAGIVAANAGHTLQKRGVGTVEVNLLARLKLVASG